MHVKQSKFETCYILDNGGYTAKIGTTHSKQPEVIPNCIMKVKSERRRPFVGDQINECRDASGLFYMLPFQRGYIVNWDIQKTVWDYIFTKSTGSAGRLADMPICITEPNFNFQSNQEAMDEIFFEEYESCGLLRLTAPDLAAYYFSKTKAKDRCTTCLVIDTGYSFTHIVPFIDGKQYLNGVKRIDIGGKVLTNHLKEIISYRQLHVMDETYVINQVKEDSCYVSTNFRADMYQTSFKDKRNQIIRDYVLPDYSTVKRGYLRTLNEENDEHISKCVKPQVSKYVNGGRLNGMQLYKSERENDAALAVAEQQIIVLNNERITIPEILFSPADIGINQMGLAEAVVESINCCPSTSMYSLLGNIIVVGGNANFPHFRERLLSEIKQRFDENVVVHIFIPPNPITYPWFGGQLLTSGDDFYKFMTRKEEYEEYGHAKERTKTFHI